MNYYGLASGVLFILLGITLITDIFGTSLPQNIKIEFSLLTLVYGIFRVVISLTKQKARNEE